MWDDVAGKASHVNRDKYVVLQVVLTEKFLGTGSGTKSLTNLQAEINKQAEKGYRLHTISTSSSGSKGFLGGDKIQATMVFERIDYKMSCNAYVTAHFLIDFNNDLFKSRKSMFIIV